MYRTDHTRRDLNIAEMYCDGQSTLDIAKSVGLSNQRISQILNTDQIKQIVDTTLRGYLAHAPVVKDKFLKHISSDDDKISLDAIKEWHKVTRLSSPHTDVHLLNQIYVDNRQTTVTPADARVTDAFSSWYLAQGQGDTDDPNIIDVGDNAECPIPGVMSTNSGASLEPGAEGTLVDSGVFEAPEGESGEGT